MECRTFKGLLLCMGSVFALTGLTACNVTDFSVAPESIAELDKLDPSKQSDPDPTPSSPPVCYPPRCAAPPAGCNYVDPIIADGCLQSCGTIKCDPVPTPTPPVPTPTPTPPVPSPTPTPPVPTPTPTPPVPSPTPTSNVKSGSNEFSPPAVEVAPKVDLLFVVDNSGSMSNDQNILAQSFGDFIKAFKDREVDYQIGVTSTDTTAYGNGKYWNDGKLNGYNNPGPGQLLSKFMNLWVVPSDSNVVGHFTANAKLGTKGAGSEQGLQSLELFLADGKIGKGGFNEGFIREDAMLSVVVVSDEDNDIKESGLTPEKLADRVIARLGQVKGPKSRGYSCDFVIDLNAKAPSGGVAYPLPGGTNSYPNAYLKASEKMGCRNLNISKNWGPDLVKIGYDIINQAEKEFKLSAKPIQGTIVVKIDGKVVAADATNGYVFHADRQTIELKGDALRMSPGAKIVVDYQYIAQ